MTLRSPAVLLVVMLAIEACSEPNRLTLSPLIGPLEVAVISPAVIPADEPMKLDIYGRGFRNDSILSISGAAASIEVKGPGYIVATPIQLPPGVFDVIVTNPSGESARKQGGLTVVPFELSSVLPRRAFAGELMSVSGSGFLTATRVSIGGAIVSPANVTPQLMFFNIPPHAAGTVDVVVMQPSGSSRTLAAAFTFDEVVMEVSPTQVAPGAPVVLTWTSSASHPISGSVGLYRVGGASNQELQEFFTGTQASGSFTLTAPSATGAYEFRFFLDDAFGLTARSAPFTVMAAGQF